MTRIIELSLKRASVTLLIALALVGAGVYSILEINQELTPDLEFPIVTVVTSMPGAAPEDVAEQVTVPLEAEVANINGLANLNTVSTENVSIMVAQFDFGQDMLVAEQELQRSVDAANISDNASTPTITRLNLDDVLPVVQLSLSGDLETPELEEIAQSQIESDLAGIDGVQAVSVMGGVTQQILIEYDPQELQEAGISTDQISGVLEASNISLPAGSIDHEEGSRSVRVDGTLTSIEEMESLIVGADTTDEEQPIPIQLGDVANISFEDLPAGSISRTNGLPSIGIAITKTQDANTVAVASDVMDVVADVEPDLPEGVEIDTILDQSVFIEEAISGLSRDAAFGAAAAVIAVWALLLSFRSAIIVGISMPLAVLATILVLFSQGMTLNILTLGGLAIAIGRVIDDSIVVLENVFRHIQEGGDLDKSIVAGAREVTVPIIGSTLTAIGVFVPLIFAGGIVGELFTPFALTVTIAMVASPILALTIIPVIARYWVGNRGPGQRTDEAGGGDTWLQRWYTPVLRWSLAHRFITILVATVLFVGSLGLLYVVPTTLLPEEGDPEFAVSVSFPPGVADEDEVIAAAIDAEEVIADLPGVAMFNTNITLGGGDDVFSLGRAMTGQGTLGVDFFIQLDEDVEAPEIRELAREQLEALDDDLLVSVQGGADQAQQNQLQLSVVGDDQTEVREWAGEVLEAIQDVAGLEELSSAAVASETEFLVEVDAAAALALNVTPVEIAQDVREIIVGEDVTSISIGENGEELSVVLSANVDEITSIEDLGNIMIGPPEQPVPLSEVAELQEVTGPAQITRENEQAAGIIQGEISGRETGEVQSDIDSRVAELDLPPGVSVEYGGALEQFEEGFETLILGILVAIVVVYVAMVLVMGSLVYPFIIMFTLPLTVIGALAALAITDTPLSIAALFGLLMLVGIVVANGIVLIDFINQLRGREMSVYEALVEGGRLRVRPVIMTSFSTMLALLPMALGLTEGAEIARDLAIVTIGGLFSSTLLTLVVVPVIYSLIESLRGRLFGGDGDGGGSPSSPDPSHPQPQTSTGSPIPPLKQLE